MRNSIRRRHVDRCAMSIRHSDGLKDMAMKIKAKVKSVIDEFKSLPTGKKIARTLGVLLSLVGSVFAVNNAAEIIKKIKKIEYTKRQVNEEFNNYMLQAMNGMDTEIGEMGEIAPSIPHTLTPIPVSHSRLLYQKGAIKTILGLVGAFCGIMMQKYAKNK